MRSLGYGRTIHHFGRRPFAIAATECAANVFGQFVQDEAPGHD
jgi:hypothetical protein